MAHDETTAGLLGEVTDTHLADRARLGDAIAFDELVRRHLQDLTAFVTVVGGDAQAVTEVAERAFTDVFDQIGRGTYSIDDPFLPGLLRSARSLTGTTATLDARAVAAIGATAGANLRAVMTLWTLDEPQRSACWLVEVLGLEHRDAALVLGVSEADVAPFLAAAFDHLGASLEVVAPYLTAIEGDLASTAPDEIRATWRAWVRSTGGAVAGTHHWSVPARFEPAVTRILRGAAVLLMVAGTSGLLTGSSDGRSSAATTKPTMPPGQQGAGTATTPPGATDETVGSSTGPGPTAATSTPAGRMPVFPDLAGGVGSSPAASGGSANDTPAPEPTDRGRSASSDAEQPADASRARTDERRSDGPTGSSSGARPTARPTPSPSRPGTSSGSGSAVATAKPTTTGPAAGTGTQPPVAGPAVTQPARPPATTPPVPAPTSAPTKPTTTAPPTTDTPPATSPPTTTPPPPPTTAPSTTTAPDKSPAPDPVGTVLDTVLTPVDGLLGG